MWLLHGRWYLATMSVVLTIGVAATTITPSSSSLRWKIAPTPSGDMSSSDATNYTGSATADHRHPKFFYDEWSSHIKKGKCSEDETPIKIPIKPTDPLEPDDYLLCSTVNWYKTYQFPPGIFEIDEQLLVPEWTAIVGAKSPTDWSDPQKVGWLPAGWLIDRNAARVGWLTWLGLALLGSWLAGWSKVCTSCT